MKNYILLLIVIVFCTEMSAQVISENISGQVSFTGSENVYVKFKSTEGIHPGDSLFVTKSGVLTPVLIVTNLSSTSCVCRALPGNVFKVSDYIIARPEYKTEKPVERTEKPVSQTDIAENDTIQDLKKSNLQKQRIKGSISAYSYSDFSNTSADNSYRFRYTLSLDARNIADSKFSAETYISFRHKAGEWDDVKDNVYNALKIYNLAVKYDLNKNLKFSLGRKINPKISSIGAMDGLQIESVFRKFSFGALAGSRPDYRNYAFDPGLFQYGAYAAYNSSAGNAMNESSVAFMQQTNNGSTDRRFLYFQHSNSLLKNIFLFGTFEVDLYKLQNGLPQSTMDPTGIYLSLRYKMSKKIGLSGSYDARKNVMYYETYKSTIDTLLEKELRQGFRLQANYRISKDMMFGLQGGYRFLKSDPKPSRNVYSYFTYSMIPLLNVSATLTATYLESGYMNGKIFGINTSKDAFKGKLQCGIGYRYVDYRLPESRLNIIQHIGEMNLSWQFIEKMSLSVNVEGTFEPENMYNRIYFQIRKRF